jgi:immunoglobulin heavy chain
MGRICYEGSIYYSPSLKSPSTISRDISLNKFFIQLSSVTDEDTAMYYYSRENHTVRDLCVSPDINFLQQC